jgi:hypothetical protein
MYVTSNPTMLTVELTHCAFSTNFSSTQARDWSNRNQLDTDDPRAQLATNCDAFSLIS